MEFIGSIFTFFLMIICLGIWLIPIIFIAASDKTCGKEKAAWILAVIFVSWFAWIFYWLLAPLKRSSHYRY